jgi:acetolactate synthase-1/2/3 large subunit
MLGGHGEVVREPPEIRPAQERARESGKPSLVDVVDRPGCARPRTHEPDDGQMR